MNGVSEKMDEAQQPSPQVEKKPGFLQRTWRSLGIDAPTIIVAATGALPPIIVLAAYQADAIARQYSTLGYLVAIQAMLSLAMQPRAKFLRAMSLSLLFTCTGAAIALLQVQTCVAARNREGPPSTSTTGSSGSQQAIQYSAGASVTAAVWLFFTVYVANVFRALRPQLMIAVIQYIIFTMVASTYAPHFPNMEAGMDFVKRLLTCFLTGFGIATGVNLFVVPMTSRMIATKQFGGLLGLLKGALASHGTLMHAITTAHEQVSETQGAAPDLTEVKIKAQGLRKNLAAVGELYGKAKLELGFAKKEFGYGKLGPDNYAEVFKRLSEIILPVIGMSTFLDILVSVRDNKERRDRLVDSNETLEAIRLLETQEWIEAMSISRDPYAKAKHAFDQGLSHIGYVLELTPKPKKPKTDVEKDANSEPTPGDKTFAIHLENAVRTYHEHRSSTIKTWCEQKGIDVPNAFWDDPAAHMSWKDAKSMAESVRQAQNHQQLYLILYMEYLMHSIGQAILQAVKYADSKVDDGTMLKKRFINPGLPRLTKLFTDIFRNKDAENALAEGQTIATKVWVGDSLDARKDPEHLPPKNAYERATNHLRGISSFFSSDASAAGFRAAVATISIGILAYIRQTQEFFLEQRVLWAMIMVAISMDATTGRGLFGFAGRIFGTAVAMVASIVIWYIGYKQPGAIIPIFYIYLILMLLFMMKNFQLAIVGMISMVTAVLIVGYELQEIKIGREVTESNGQTFYEIYILAPFRLGTVVAGIAVAFFWTYFPYPVTTHGTLRKDLGATLYLLANYYSCLHTTVSMRLTHGPRLNEADKKSPMAKLGKARMKCFSKIMVLLSKLREHSGFTRWEPPFGGEFPKKQYDDLIDSLEHVFNYINLISYSSAAFATAGEDGGALESEWLRDFRQFTAELQLTSHEMTSILCLVSASVTDGQPLPPYLRVPKPYGIAAKMESVDPGILSVQHINEPCYAAFAVLEVASSLIVEEVGGIVRGVRELVGEVDFSFHVVSTTTGDGTSVNTLLGEEDDGEKGKRD